MESMFLSALNVWLILLVVILWPFLVGEAIGSRLRRPRLGAVVGWFLLACLLLWSLRD